jgi:acyl-CoA thioesterase
VTVASQQEIAERIVKGMTSRDGFSAWLGIEIVAITPTSCTLRMKVRHDMLNGFGVCHGGVTYSLADSALAFASNGHGRVTMSINNSISYPAPVHEGDVLTAVAEQESASNRIAFFRVEVRNQNDISVAHFRGTVYRTSKQHQV